MDIGVDRRSGSLLEEAPKILGYKAYDHTKLIHASTMKYTFRYVENQQN